MESCRYDLWLIQLINKALKPFSLCIIKDVPKVQNANMKDGIKLENSLTSECTSGTDYQYEKLDARKRVLKKHTDDRSHG